MATSKSTTAKKTSTAAKPAAKKTSASAATTTKKTLAAAKPAAKKPAAATRTAVAKKPTTTKPAVAPSPEQRYRMVQEAAYFIAEKNGFVAGSLDYWIAAEAEIDAVLSGKSKKK